MSNDVPARRPPSADNTRPPRVAVEDVVLISMIGLGFLLPAASFVFKLPLQAWFLALLAAAGVAALVYRFLGGIDAGSSMSLGAVRLGGSMAALVGFWFLLNPEIHKQQEKDIFDELADAQRLKAEAEQLMRQAEDLLATDFQAMIVDIGHTREIGGEKIKLVDIKRLKARDLSEAFERTLERIGEESRDLGFEEPSEEVRRSLLEDFCQQIGFALHLDEGSKSAMRLLPALYFDEGAQAVDREWWGSVVGPLFKERCGEECPAEKSPDQLWAEAKSAKNPKGWHKDIRDLREALNSYPYAIYWQQGSEGNPVFKVVVPGGSSISIGGRRFTTPVVANPRGGETEMLVDPEGEKSPIMEALVLAPVQ